jgi:hypothetical protein
METDVLKQIDAEMGISIPVKALTKAEQQITGEEIGNRLLIIHSAPTAYVLLAQAENLLETAKKSIKEKAINGIHGKEEIVLGAKVTTRNATKVWEYQGSKFETLTAELATAKKRLSDYTKQLELAGSDGVVNQETGETEKAILVSGGGLNIAVSFGKE